MDTINKIFFLVGDFKKKIYVIFFLILIGSILEFVSLGVLIPIISFFIDENNFQFKFLSSLVGENYIFYILTIIFGVFLFKAVYFVMLNFYKNLILAKIASNLSRKLFEKYMYQDFLFFSRKSSPKLISNIEESIAVINANLSAVINIFIDFSLGLSIIVFLLFVEFNLTIILFLTFLFSGLIYYFLIRNRLKKMGEKKYILRSEKLRSLQDGFNGIREIKIFNIEKIAIANFFKSNSRLLKIFGLEVSFQSLPKILLELLIIILFISLVSILILLDKENSYIGFILGIFLMAAIRTLPIISRSISSFQILKFGQKALDTVFNEMKNLDNYEQNINERNSKDVKFLKKLNFENVSFEYEQNKKIISNLSFEIKKGDIITIKGISGSGKTTIIDLLSGLIIPSNGKIKIDDNELTRANIYNWHKKIGYVSQNIFIKEGSVFENISFNKETLIKDKSFLENILKISCVDEFLNNLKDGINTNIGERGLLLSGGQKQRIGIARALYGSPDLIIFDEATNAIDVEMESKIINNIKNFYPQSTLILISHRNEIIKYSDNVIDLNKKN